MNHYETLGVPKTATPDEIKKAYRKLAGQHHPDRGGDTATFQKIQVAYDTLSDPNKKQQYDNPSPFGRNPDSSGFPGGFQFNMGPDFQDIISQMFGNQNRGFNQQRNQIFRTHVAISLEAAYLGASHVLKIQTPTDVKVANIDIPKGVTDGSQVRYDNILDNATLVVEYRIMPDLKFDRKGNDLYCNHPISVLDLIVGTSFEFITISGRKFEVSVKPKTQPYMQLKVAGQGMPILGTGAYGDQIILLKPLIPDIIHEDITESILRSKSN